MRKGIILLAICVLLLNSAAAYAEEDSLMAIGDLCLSRPLGIAATVIGGAVFVVALPFALTSGSVKGTADVLVGEPFNFTFKRPLGNFRQYRAYAPPEKPKEEKQPENMVPGEQKEPS